MRYLSILLLGLATATSVCCLPEQEHFADLVSSQPVHTTEGWSYEDCGLSLNVFAIVYSRSIISCRSFD